MTAPLTDYTTYNDIRAAIGVSLDDIDDATLGLGLYADYLETELEDINIDLPTTFATTKADPTPTAAESRFLQACRLFATYAIAKQLTSSLPIFAAKQMTDGKAAMTRFDNPYKEAIASVNQQYDKMRNRLTQALAAVGTSTETATSLVFVSVVSPSVDPVTGL